MTRRTRRPVGSVVMIVLGVLVLLTPVVLTHVKNEEQARIAQDYSSSVARLDDARRAQMLEAARAYNTRLPEVGAPDPWLHGSDVDSPEYREYLGLLDVDGVMARLRVDAVGIDLPVHHGTSQRVLAAGVGHLHGTALPVGGEGTHAVLTGHTGLATLTMFDDLNRMEVGDVFVVETLGETLAYEVDRISVVLPEEIQAVRPEAGRDLVTLVTCTPYGINTHRLLVRGERVALPAVPEAQEYSSPWQPWMIAAVVMSVCALAYLLWWARSRRRDDDTPGADAAAHAATPAGVGRR